MLNAKYWHLKPGLQSSPTAMVWEAEGQTPLWERHARSHVAPSVPGKTARHLPPPQPMEKEGNDKGLKKEENKKKTGQIHIIHDATLGVSLETAFL